MKQTFQAVAVVVSLSLTVPAEAFFGWGRSEPAATTPVGAVIVELSGKVETQSRDSETWEPAVLQQTLNPGDMVMTDADGTAVVLFLDGSKIRLSQNAAFVMEQMDEKEVKLEVKFGVFEAWVKKLRTRRWRVRTPSGVAAIRGTDFVIRLVSPDGTIRDFASLQQLIESNTPISVDTVFELFTGSLDVTDGFGNRTGLLPGQQLTADTNTGISRSKPQSLPQGTTMAKKPSSEAAAKKAAADAEKRAESAKKKAAEAEKKAKDAEKKGDKAGAQKAQQEADKARKESNKAELVKQVAQEIVKMEALANLPVPPGPPPPPPGGPLPPPEGFLPPPGGFPNPLADEAIEDEEGIAGDVSPSSP